MNFIKIYEYLFLQCYSWSLKTNGKNLFTKYHAVLMLSLVLLTNIATLILLIELTTSFSLLDKIVKLPKSVIIIFLIVNFVLHYSYFSRRERYLEIERKSPSDGYGQRVFLGYIIFSFIVFITLLMFVAQ